MTPYPRRALPLLALAVLAGCSTAAQTPSGPVDPALLCSPDGDMRLCKERCGDRTSGYYFSADGCRFNLHDGTNDIPYFATRSDVIDAEAQKALILAAKILRNYGFRFDIVGNAANCDDEATNQALSVRRAENVRQALLALGVRDDQIVSISGMGSRRSFSSTPPACNDHFNDRVDLNLVDVREPTSKPG